MEHAVCTSSVCETKESMDKRIIKIVRHFGNIFLLNGIGIFYIMDNYSGESYFFGNVVDISLLEIIWQNTPRGTRSVHDGVKYHQYEK